MLEKPFHRPRVAAFQPCRERLEALQAALPEAGFEVVCCATVEALVEQSLQRAPDLILCQPCPGHEVSAGLLRLLRHVSGGAPLVVVSEGTSLQMQRLAQQFRPIIFVLEPLDPVELRDTVGAAIAQRRMRSCG